MCQVIHAVLFMYYLIGTTLSSVITVLPISQDEETETQSS